MSAVPTVVDLFNRIKEQEDNAQAFGFYWENVEQLLDQVISEAKEVQEAHLQENAEHIREEIGDLLNAVVSLSLFLKIDPASALKESIDKFQRRYDQLVKLVEKDGLTNLQDKSMDVLLSYWERAKVLEE